MKQGKQSKLKKKNDEDIGDMLKNDFKKYSKIIQAKSKETIETAKEKSIEFQKKAKPFIVKAYNNIKSKVIEIKKKAVPFFKKVVKKTKPFLAKVWKIIKEILILILGLIILSYNKLKPIVLNLFNKTKNKVINYKNDKKDSKQKNKEEKKQTKKVKLDSQNDSKFASFFTKKRIILGVILILFLYFFSAPIYYRLFYGPEEVRLLQPPRTRFQYPRSTMVECPEGRVCESFFTKTPSIFEQKCPISCDDDNPCTLDICDESTNFKCVNKPIQGCNFS